MNSQFELNYKKIVITRDLPLTVFMLTHNREKYLKLAIDSVLNQTFDNYILVILDNISSDNTEFVVSSVNSPKILYLKRESTLEYSNTRYARDICLTKYFIILHDDDILEADYLERVLDTSISIDADALSPSAMIINENGVITKRRDYTGKICTYTGKSYIHHRFLNSSLEMIYPAVLYKTSFYKNFPYFDGNPEVGPSGDQFIWFETERIGGKLAILDEGLIRYRRHSNQESNINGGFMTLQLLDYLYKDKYYFPIISEMKEDISRKIIECYITIALKYYRGQISREKYRTFFDFSCTKLLENSLKGRLHLCALRSIFSHEKIIRFILKGAKKI